MEVVEYLEVVLKVCGPNKSKLKYRNCEDFVLQNGVEMKYKSLPKQVKRGEMRMCFMNAFCVAEKYNFTYVEGYALSIIPTLHAWCVDGDGFVVDPTWKDGKEYFGVEFPFDFVRATMIKRGSWGVIDNWENGFPLLTGEKWKGGN